MFKLRVRGLDSRFGVLIAERVRERLGRLRSVAWSSRNDSKTTGNAFDELDLFETNIDTLSAAQDRRFRE